MKHERLDIPNEPGEWIEIRPLSFTERDELHQASASKFLAELSGLPDDVLTAQVRVQTEAAEQRREENARRAAAGEPPLPDPELPDPDALDGIDVLTVLQFGIFAWSYRDEDGGDIPVDDQQVAALDHDTARWAAREIVLRTVPIGTSTDTKKAEAAVVEPVTDEPESEGHHESE